MSRCILTLACGEEYRKQSEVMISSFLEHNSGWEVERVYDDAIKLPSIFKNDIVSPFNRCEVGRWVMMKEMLGKYDEVLYCDNDTLWYDEYRPLDASIVLSPHYITNQAKYDARMCLFWFGVYNIGLVYMKGEDARKGCDFVLNEFSRKPIRFFQEGEAFLTIGAQKHTIWLQSLGSCLMNIGLDCIVDNDAGLNVAHWNLDVHERSVFKRDGKYIVMCGGIEYPLRMFHFSNKNSTLEKYDGAVKEIFDGYKRLCVM